VRNVNFVETGLMGHMNFIVVPYSAANSGFVSEVNIVKVSCM
jgi:hypothetical protein